MTPLVPKTQTSSSMAAGRFDKRDFRYDANRDSYRCPANEEGPRRTTTIEDGSRVHIFWPSNCPPARYAAHAPLHAIGAFDAGSTRRCWTPCNGVLIITRKPCVCAAKRLNMFWEHSRHGWGRRISSCEPCQRSPPEMSLYVLAYNMKRVIKIVGVKALMHAIAA